MQITCVIFLLLFAAACGKSNSSAGLPRQEERALPVDGSNIKGLYMAKFTTVNSHVSGDVPGSASIERKRDKFTAYVRVYGGAPNAWHQQNIYEGRRCPTMRDDLNGDNFIDAEEGKRVWGRVLIPLDKNLNSQSAGMNVFPVSDSTGTYFYERHSSFEKMFDDLRTEDKRMMDNVVKLDPKKGFDIEGRVVVIQGTSEHVYFPETVASSDGRAPHQTLPIACGIFKQVTKIPNESDIDDEPTRPEIEPRPIPNPPASTPTPDPTPDVDPEPDSPEDDEDGDEDDEWYDRVRDWWRDRWDTSRAGRVTNWGEG